MNHSSFLFISAFGTYAFHDVVDGVGQESIRQINYRNWYIVNAVGLVAHFAIEVNVLVVERMLVLAKTHLVFQAAAAILDSVDKVVLKKQGESTEYA